MKFKIHQKLNRKGIADNFLTLLFVMLCLGVIFGVLFLLMSIKMKESQTTSASDLNIWQGMYSTRVVLDSEISDGYKVYDAIIDYENGQIQGIDADLAKAIGKFYPDGKITDKWIIIIDGEKSDACFAISGAGTSFLRSTEGLKYEYDKPGSEEQPDSCDFQERMPKVTVPNPQGKNILVLFKPQSILDGKTSRLFGYRADLMKGVSSDSLPEYSFDGQKLAEIENIPDIECNVEDTTVGKICAADEKVVDRLRLISSETLQKENLKIVITQAYRTYEIQKNLYNEWCSKGNCGNGCNPDTSYACPHMLAGAVDVIMLDSSGRALNGASGYDPQKVEDIMCNYGFVRYNKEDWHFEYGTKQWSIAEEKRAGGEKACVY